MISVIMPAYNMERFIETAIRSVMDQTYRDWELLVIDDVSRDSTCQIVRRLAAEDPRIRLIRNEKNMGVAKTRNRGFDLCKGDYVALLDSDDIWHPEKLSCQMQLAEETGAGLIYCSYAMVDEDGNKRCEDFIVPEETDYARSLTRSVLSCSTALLSREITDTYRFTSEYYHEDLAFWLQILRDGHKARGVSRVLAQYRVRKQTRSSDKLMSAARRWPIYRKLLGYSVWDSLKLIAQYGYYGLRKYAG